MSASITGDFILLDPFQQAMFDPINERYRFYYIYKSYIPLDSVKEVGIISDDLSAACNLESRVAIAEVWLPVMSPEIGFPDRSLAYIRGRMILPGRNNCGDDDNETVGESPFKIYVEVIRGQFKRCLPSSHWTYVLLRESIRPEPMVIGRIKTVTFIYEVDGSVSRLVLIEVKEIISNNLEVLLIA